MKILVPVDLSQSTDVLDLVAYAARRLAAEVHLFTVVPPDRAHVTIQLEEPAGAFSLPSSGDSSGGIIRPAFSAVTEGPAGTVVETRDQALDRITRTAKERLQLLTAHLQDVPVTVDVALRPHVAEAIADYVGRNGVDLIVMRTHGRAGVRRAVLGSVAEDVVRSVDVPVLLVGPSFGGVEPAYDELIVCVDGSDASEKILPLARWVRSLNLRVTIATAVPSGHGSATAAAAGEYVKRIGKSLLRDAVATEWTVIPGADPAAAITSYAAERPTSIVALVSRARTGLPRLVAGSVAMRVVHDSSNPVLVIHAQHDEDATR